MKVILVDDFQPDTCDGVKTAISFVFGSTVGTIEVAWHKPATKDWDHEAQTVIAQGPDVVLADDYMPESGDGIALLRALRRRDFAGFTYLWTSSSRSAIDELIRQHELLLKGVGTGGFCNQTETQALAAKIKRDFDACGKVFVVPNPGDMIFDPLDMALDILTDLLPLCFSSDNRGQILDRARKAIGCDNTDPTFAKSFRQRVITSFPSQVGQLAGPSAAVREIANELVGSDPTHDIEKIAKLRDALLEVCRICEEV